MTFLSHKNNLISHNFNFYLILMTSHEDIFFFSWQYWASIWFACLCATVHEIPLRMIFSLCAPKHSLQKINPENIKQRSKHTVPSFWEFAHSGHNEYSGVFLLDTLASSLSFSPTHTQTHTHTPSYSLMLWSNSIPQCHQPRGQSEISFAVQKQKTEGGYSRMITSQWRTRWRRLLLLQIQVNICSVESVQRGEGRNALVWVTEGRLQNRWGWLPGGGGKRVANNNNNNKNGSSNMNQQQIFLSLKISELNSKNLHKNEIKYINQR